MAASLRPMIPARAPRSFHRPGWVYEEKIDGYRMLAVKDGSRVAAPLQLYFCLSSQRLSLLMLSR
jgi:hypothetical protein